MEENTGYNLLMMDDDEAGLVDRATAGEHAAFEELTHRHIDRVFRLALRMLGSREDAEDVMQETCITAYRRICTFRREASFGAWLCSVAARICLTYRRKSLRHPSEVLAEPDLLAASCVEDPEDRLIALESARKVQRALSLLAPSDRLLIVLKCIEQASHEEIAQILRCTVESSRSRLARAKKLFITHYEQME